MSRPEERPDTQRIMSAVDATWPPAEYRKLGPWLLRRGASGGQRVSAASSGDQAAAIEPAIEGMKAWGQDPLFRVTPDQPELDSRLEQAGFRRHDPVALYAAPAADLDDSADHTVKVFDVGAPLAIVDEIWTAGGIGPGRRAVMARARGQAKTLMARADDQPVGVAFVATDGDIAMIHAIEVAPQHRRKGGGALLIRGAARFATQSGAQWLTLAVTEANGPARALYEKLGMAHVGGYHYRALAR